MMSIFKKIGEWFYYLGNPELKGLHRFLDSTAKIESHFQQFRAYNHGVFFNSDKPRMLAISKIKDKETINGVVFYVFIISEKNRSETIENEIMEMDYKTRCDAERERVMFSQYSEEIKRHIFSTFPSNRTVRIKETMEEIESGVCKITKLLGV